MSDYIKKSDAIRTSLEALNTNTLYAARAGAVIGKLPAVDAVPVVRCGECMHRRQPDGFCPVVGGFCGDENWFCASGIKEER